MEQTQSARENAVPQKTGSWMPRKKRKWPRRVITLGVVAALVVGFFFWKSSQPKQYVDLGYIPTAAETKDITVSVTGTGTVQPIDSYKVTALVKGEVLDAPFEEGDQVGKDDLLFRIDAKDAENGIERAQLAVEQSQLSYNEAVRGKGDALKNVELKANATGVVQKLYYKVGDMVAAGTPVADILDRDSLLLTVPFHAADAALMSKGQAASVSVSGTYETLSGTVDSIAVSDQAGAGGTLVREVKIKVHNPGALSDGSAGTASVGTADCAAAGIFTYAAQKTLTAKASGELAALSVKEGDRVTDGQAMGSLKAADLDAQVESALLGLRSSQLSLQSSQDQMDGYTVKAPISGTVIEKNYKTGDNVDPSAAAGSAGYMAIIYDMSTLTFKMSIDELDVGKVKVGQEVEITAAALEGEVFTGRVDKISINGTTAGGATSYPVTVVIDAPKNLLPGMNVSAKIITERAKNLLVVPVEAVTRSASGGTITVALPGALSSDGTLVMDPSKLEPREVKLGRGDSDYVEITEGLEPGEVVVYQSLGSSYINSMMGG